MSNFADFGSSRTGICLRFADMKPDEIGRFMDPILNLAPLTDGRYRIDRSGFFTDKVRIRTVKSVPDLNARCTDNVLEALSNSIMDEDSILLFDSTAWSRILFRVMTDRKISFEIIGNKYDLMTGGGREFLESNGRATVVETTDDTIQNVLERFGNLQIVSPTVVDCFGRHETNFFPCEVLDGSIGDGVQFFNELNPSNRIICRYNEMYEDWLRSFDTAPTFRNFLWFVDFFLRFEPRYYDTLSISDRPLNIVQPYFSADVQRIMWRSRTDRIGLNIDGVPRWRIRPVHPRYGIIATGDGSDYYMIHQRDEFHMDLGIFAYFRKEAA